MKALYYLLVIIIKEELIEEIRKIVIKPLHNLI